MSSLVAARSLRAPPFPLKPATPPSSYGMTRLVHTFDNRAAGAAAADMVTRKIDSLYCTKPSNWKSTPMPLPTAPAVTLFPTAIAPSSKPNLIAS